MATDAEKVAGGGIPTTSPVWNRLVFVLALLGAGIASYLTWAHASGADIPCGARGDCAAVAASGYSRFLGVPVAAWGAALYLALAGVALARERTRDPNRDKALLLLLLIGAGAGTIASLYLTYRELFTIRALCAWCLASQLVMLALLGAAVWDALLRRGASGETKLLLGLATLVILGAGSLFALEAVADLPARPPAAAVAAEAFEALLKDARHVKGSPDAPVTIVEFADFECRACRRAYASVASRLGTTIPVRFAFRHLPLETVHPHALPAALAAEAAGRQNKFWEMYDALFTDKDPNAEPVLDEAAIEERARRIGLDMARFRADRKSAEMEALVRADAERAAALGVRETPTFLIREEASGRVTVLTSGSGLNEYLRRKNLLSAAGR